ncbi:MAG: sulfatase [Verrucomicrobiales bacterium]|nr:sulfatase [Verrucomicrobiales bacterium]
MNRFWALMLCLVAGACQAQDAPARPPNILFILADDLGWSDLGFTGSRFYDSPHLDAMAAAGLRFTSFYTSPNCTPTRASFLTGQYAPRTGIYTVGSPERGDPAARRMVPPQNRTSLPADCQTIASILKAQGYATGYLGKWQLGNEPAELPGNFGFDESIVTSEKHLGFECLPPQEVPAGTYLADFLTERAVDFIGRHKDRPFFLQVSHFAVHAPYEAKPDVVARFAKKAPSGGHRDAVYAAMIASVDDSVGRLVGRLAELRIESNTVVIFTSDNGGVGGYIDPENGGRRSGITDNAPLRGGKGMLYDGGVRVPFLVKWPGVTPAGSRTPQPCAHVDLLPTLCEIAGTRPPSKSPIDGVSFVPLLRNPGASLGRDAIFWHFPGYLEAYGRAGWRTTPAGAVRAGNFKLIEYFEDGRTELFNVVEDIGEKNNLVRSLPDKTSELQAKLAAWRKALDAPMPVAKPTPAGTAPAPATAASRP